MNSEYISTKSKGYCLINRDVLEQLVPEQTLLHTVYTMLVKAADHKTGNVLFCKSYAMKAFEIGYAKYKSIKEQLIEAGLLIEVQSKSKSSIFKIVHYKEVTNKNSTEIETITPENKITEEMKNQDYLRSKPIIGDSSKFESAADAKRTSGKLKPTRTVKSLPDVSDKWIQFMTFIDTRLIKYWTKARNKEKTLAAALEFIKENDSMTEDEIIELIGDMNAHFLVYLEESGKYAVAACRYIKDEVWKQPLERDLEKKQAQKTNKRTSIMTNDRNKY